jgi:hypothetical protein
LETKGGLQWAVLFHVEGTETAPGKTLCGSRFETSRLIDP